MWFNNAIVFKFEAPFSLSNQEISALFEEHRLKPCPKHARQTIGFTHLLNTDKDMRVYSVQGCHVGLLAKENRLLPASVIKKTLDEKLQQYEIEHQKPMRRSEKQKLKEEIEFDLLPKAFTVNKKEWFYIDTMKQWLIIDSSNPNNASELIAALRRALGNLNLKPLSPESSLTPIFNQWLKQPKTLPSDLYFGRQCELASAREDKSTFHCRKIDNALDEIHTLLSKGLNVTAIELVWQERLRFILTDNFIIKRIKCLDYLDDALKDNGKLEHAHEKLDADLALLTGEMRALVSQLVSVFDSASINVQKVDFPNAATA